jgi:hypothetical protein
MSVVAAPADCAPASTAASTRLVLPVPAGEQSTARTRRGSDEDCAVTYAALAVAAPTSRNTSISFSLGSTFSA